MENATTPGSSSNTSSAAITGKKPAVPWPDRRSPSCRDRGLIDERIQTLEPRRHAARVQPGEELAGEEEGAACAKGRPPSGPAKPNAFGGRLDPDRGEPGLDLPSRSGASPRHGGMRPNAASFEVASAQDHFHSRSTVEQERSGFS